MYYPSIIETIGRNTRAYDLPSKLLQDRIIYLGGEINSDSANFIIMQLLWLNADDPEKDINLYINSPGGHIYDGIGIIDVVISLDAKVNTLGVGIVASMGVVLLSAGTGERKCMKNTRIMIHSMSSATEGNYHDMKVDFKESEFLQKQMISLLAKNTKDKTSYEEIEKLTQRDYFMNPVKAQTLGLIDKIV